MNPVGDIRRAESYCHTRRTDKFTQKLDIMLERILSRENLILALKRVERNKGSHGVDEMPVQNLRAHIMEHWTTLREELQEGTYHPHPVRHVEIPKPNGGKRKLGIPTVLDRFIQQEVAQVLTEEYDPPFSKHSYGFRLNKRGHDAVREARKYISSAMRTIVIFMFVPKDQGYVMGNITKFIEGKLKLKVNEEKVR